MDKVVFFDIDDTLVDTSRFAKLARQAAIIAMVDNGLPLSNEEGYKLLKEIVSQKGSNYDKHFNVLTKTVLGYEDYKLIATGMITYHNVKFALLRPFPRINETLMHLKTKGYKLAVISNGVTIKQWEKLVRMNLHHYFDKITTSEEIGFEKPNERIFKEALSSMNCSAEKSIMVGNKLKEDAMGGVNAGMSSILVNSNITEKEKQQIIDEDINITILDSVNKVDSIL